MSSARMVRGTKSRFVLYICAALVLCSMTYLFHNSQTQLDDARRSLATCTQQQESLSAQLQVIFEYKLRLEKSLQKEKADHKDTKDECLNRAQEDKLKREKESVEALNKYNALQQHFKLLQSTHKDLNEECDKVRKNQLNTVEEVSKLEHQVQSLRQELLQVKEANNKTLENYKLQYQALLQEKEQLEKDNAAEPVSTRVEKLETTNKQLEDEITQLKTALEQCRAGTPSAKNSDNRIKEAAKEAEDSFAAAVQENVNNVGAVPPKVFLTGSSTTPVINPDAVIDHDDPMRQGQKDGFNKSSTAASLSVDKLSQEQAPLDIPAQSVGGLDSPQQPQQLDNTHQLAPPDSIVVQPNAIPVGPMNPVQEEAAKLFAAGEQDDGRKLSNENLLEQQRDAAEEEDQQSKLDEIPKGRREDYRGGDYDKEDDEEGEQMDYDVKQQHQQQILQMHNRPPQSRHLNRQNGGGIMVNPK